MDQHKNCCDSKYTYFTIFFNILKISYFDSNLLCSKSELYQFHYPLVICHCHFYRPYVKLFTFLHPVTYSISSRALSCPLHLSSVLPCLHHSPASGGCCCRRQQRTHCLLSWQFPTQNPRRRDSGLGLLT